MSRPVSVPPERRLRRAATRRAPPRLSLAPFWLLIAPPFGVSSRTDAASNEMRPRSIWIQMRFCSDGVEIPFEVLAVVEQRAHAADVERAQAPLAGDRFGGDRRLEPQIGVVGIVRDAHRARARIRVARLARQHVLPRLRPAATSENTGNRRKPPLGSACDSRVGVVRVVRMRSVSVGSVGPGFESDVASSGLESPGFGVMSTSTGSDELVVDRDRPASSCSRPDRSPRNGSDRWASCAGRASCRSSAWASSSASFRASARIATVGAVGACLATNVSYAYQRPRRGHGERSCCEHETLVRRALRGRFGGELFVGSLQHLPRVERRASASTAASPSSSTDEP
jgi:hypothetical protein